MTEWYEEYDLLLADSSVLFRFFESGADITTAFMAAVGDRIYVVESVDGEIEKYRNDPAMADGIAAFRAAQVNAPLEPALEVTREVQKIRDLNRRHGLGGLDLGEYETVLTATHEWDNGTYYLMLMGDSGGRSLARQRDLPCVTSYEFVLALVLRGVLDRDQGILVARTIFGGQFDEERFDDDLASRQES